MIANQEAKAETEAIASNQEAFLSQRVLEVLPSRGITAFGTARRGEIGGLARAGSVRGGRTRRRSPHGSPGAGRR